MTIADFESSLASFRQRVEEAKRLQLCVECGKPFTKENVTSSAGWRETQISGMCEKCFDRLFDEDAPLEPGVAA